MMFRRGKWVLFSPDGGDGGSGGGGGGGNSAGDLAIVELRQLKEKYDKLVDTHNEVVKNFNKLEKDHGALKTQFDSVSGELGTYKAGEARKSALEKALESAEVKGKVNVDREKALRYLNKGNFDEARLGDDIKEAIELFGEPVDPKASSLSSRGAGSEASDRANDAPENGDFIGNFALRSMGRA